MNSTITSSPAFLTSLAQEMTFDNLKLDDEEDVAIELKHSNLLLSFLEPTQLLPE